MKPLPHTYVVKGRYWYFRYGSRANTRIEGEPFSPHFMWHYRQLMAQSGAEAKSRAQRARIRRLVAASEKRDDNWVYFIGNPEGGPVKIGFAKDVQQRLCTLQVGSSAPLSLLAVTVGGAAVEKRYHEQFGSARLRGEWFDRTPEIDAEIARLGAPE